MGPIERASLVSGERKRERIFYWSRLNRFHLKRGQNPVSETSCFKEKTGRLTMSRILIVTLIFPD
jgi:hypothetical protein